jgi:hypothetical protein
VEKFRLRQTFLRAASASLCIGLFLRPLVNEIGSATMSAIERRLASS